MSATRLFAKDGCNPKQCQQERRPKKRLFEGFVPEKGLFLRVLAFAGTLAHKQPTLEKCAATHPPINCTPHRPGRE